MNVKISFFFVLLSLSLRVSVSVFLSVHACGRSLCLQEIHEEAVGGENIRFHNDIPSLDRLRRVSAHFRDENVNRGELLHTLQSEGTGSDNKSAEEMVFPLQIFFHLLVISLSCFVPWWMLDGILVVLILLLFWSLLFLGQLRYPSEAEEPDTVSVLQKWVTAKMEYRTRRELFQVLQRVGQKELACEVLRDESVQTCTGGGEGEFV